MLNFKYQFSIACTNLLQSLPTTKKFNIIDTKPNYLVSNSHNNYQNLQFQEQLVTTGYYRCIVCLQTSRIGGHDRLRPVTICMTIVFVVMRSLDGC